MNKPPTTSALRKFARDLLAGREGDWDIYHWVEEHPFYKVQLEELLREPTKQREYEAEVKAKAATEALSRLRRTLRSTCVSRRSYLNLRSLQHTNTYPWHLRMKREQIERQPKWDRFVVDLKMYRIAQAHTWIDHSHSAWISQVIMDSNPFELVKHWPTGSCCSIEPQMSPDWVLLEPPTPATVITEPKTFIDRQRAIERAYLEQEIAEFGGDVVSGITITTTDQHGKRRTTGGYTSDQASAKQQAEQRLAKQLHH